MNKQIKMVAREAILSAGQMALREYNKFNRAGVEFKSHHETLTKVDLASEKMIIKHITKNFPDHCILSEESGRNKKESPYLWIIDPIDGTTNFSIHNPLWSISIGVVYAGKIVIGLVYVPVLGELYEAELDKGAKFNGKKMKVSSIGDKRAVHTFCHSVCPEDRKRSIEYYQKQALAGQECRRMGSAAIELAYVSRGLVESITIHGARSWDVAAGVLLVRESGGRVSDFTGQEWTLESHDMLATNGLVHKETLKNLK